MKQTLFRIFLFMTCFVTFLNAESSDAKKKVAKIMQTEHGKSFLKKNSDKKLEKVILFLEKPEKYFNSIKKVKNICSYISIYEDYSYKDLNDQSVFTIFLENNFQTANNKKADILTFLLSTCDVPVYIEEIADIYTKLFKSYYRILLKPLEKTDWKKIIDRLDAGSWIDFKIGLERLGDTPFEKRFKEYVFALRDEKGYRIHKY